MPKIIPWRIPLRHLLPLLLLTSFVAGCAPSAQDNAEPASEPSVTEVQPQPSLNTQLLGNTLSVPGTDNTVAVDTPLLEGELVPFEASNDRGTLRLLSQGMSVQQGEQEFLILPVEILRVSGAGGLYLMLLEQTGETYTQRDAARLGQRVSLLRLELENDLITTTTIDSRLGKAPDFEVSRGGVMRFELEEGELVEVSS